MQIIHDNMSKHQPKINRHQVSKRDEALEISFQIGQLHMINKPATVCVFFFCCLRSWSTSSVCTVLIVIIYRYHYNLWTFNCEIKMDSKKWIYQVCVRFSFGQNNFKSLRLVVAVFFFSFAMYE